MPGSAAIREVRVLSMMKIDGKTMSGMQLLSPVFQKIS